jgi:hypothetical protein
MRWLVALLAGVPVWAACQAEVKVAEFRKVADGSDTVLGIFKVKAPAGSTVTWDYMVHAHDQYGETLHYVRPYRHTAKAEEETVEVRFQRASLKTAVVTNLEVEGAVRCSDAPAVKGRP